MNDPKWNIMQTKPCLRRFIVSRIANHLFWFFNLKNFVFVFCFVLYIIVCAYSARYVMRTGIELKRFKKRVIANFLLLYEEKIMLFSVLWCMRNKKWRTPLFFALTEGACCDWPSTTSLYNFPSFVPFVWSVCTYSLVFVCVFLV